MKLHVQDKLIINALHCLHLHKVILFYERFHTYLYELATTVGHGRFSGRQDLNETKSDAATQKFPPKCVNIETSATHLLTACTVKYLSNEDYNFFQLSLKDHHGFVALVHELT